MRSDLPGAGLNFCIIGRAAKSSAHLHRVWRDWPRRPISTILPDIVAAWGTTALQEPDGSTCQMLQDDSRRLQRDRIKFDQEAASLEFPAAATRTRIVSADLPRRIGYRTRRHQLVHAGRRAFPLPLSFRAKTIPA